MECLIPFLLLGLFYICSVLWRRHRKETRDTPHIDIADRARRMRSEYNMDEADRTRNNSNERR